jgi:hypothetical protein
MSTLNEMRVALNQQEEVARMYAASVVQAQQRTLTEEYKGCTVHVNALVQLRDGVPQIVGFSVSDWSGDNTVGSYCNGHERI